MMATVKAKLLHANSNGITSQFVDFYIHVYTQTYIPMVFYMSMYVSFYCISPQMVVLSVSCWSPARHHIACLAGLLAGWRFA